MALSAEQLEVRRGGIGSSDIAGLVGEDPFKTPFDVWLDKTGRAPNVANDQTELGDELEPVIAKKFAHVHGVSLQIAKGTMQHPRHALVMATIDRRIIEVPELVEVKNVGFRMLHKWRGPASAYAAPSYVRIQGQWQCAVVGDVEAVWAAALLGGRDFHFERIESDREEQDALIYLAEKFWRDHVVNDRAPEPDHSERARKILEQLHPKAGPTVEATDAMASLARDYAAARTAEGEAKKAKELAGNRLRQLLGDASGTRDADWGAVTWLPKGGPIAWKKVVASLGVAPEVVAAAVAKHTGKAGRTLRVTVHGQEEDEGDDFE
jgi:putative phage-type endonuclease